MKWLTPLTSTANWYLDTFLQNFKNIYIYITNKYIHRLWDALYKYKENIKEKAIATNLKLWNQVIYTEAKKGDYCEVIIPPSSLV